MKNLLVVGGTGFIGYHVVKEAQRKGFNITSLSISKPPKKKKIKKVNYITVNILNYKILRKKLHGKFDYIVNTGGYGEHPDFGKEGCELFNSHFFGLINILKVLNLKKIKRFVQIGSSAEYGKANSPLKETYKCNPKTPYSFAKLSATKLLKKYYIKKKLPITILRLFQVYGPYQDNNRIVPFLITNCLENKSFRTTKGEQICDFCYIDDVVDAVFKSFDKKKAIGEIINIGSGQPIKIKKIILFIKKIIGKGNPIIGGLNYKKENSMKNYPNIKKAKLKLHWVPNVNIITGIKKTITSYQ